MLESSIVVLQKIIQEYKDTLLDFTYVKNFLYQIQERIEFIYGNVKALEELDSIRQKAACMTLCHNLKCKIKYYFPGCVVDIQRRAELCLPLLGYINQIK
mmetsp:Transcript_78965/g.109421  ORF Transcript_78965/g.109421 Transcript_78965/m.109421 type:complete len:100 (+) Transcript_78965:346-645(+)